MSEPAAQGSPSSAALPVLAVASEMYPLLKTGGLADVVGALPAALAPHGIALRTLLPGRLRQARLREQHGRHVDARQRTPQVMSQHGEEHVPRGGDFA